ncbi:LOW QUALITY PROTEIN: DNA polymerase kappa [Colossoma macropomum]|uniref:LOW QUALITY PROTEIN: DNA polymerase kappa n=1 Tax=Colossoma macropomum TaxID=42526 RepID=UPI001863DD23|nr:LOW QUALITY PROTEIN: DNA polymerase kappa [Colossoma macropomum]
MEPNAGDGGADSNGGQNVLLSRIALNDNKAGMEGLDRDKINKIILETSKGSRFYENELKKERQVNERIEKMLRHKAKVTEQQIQKAQAEVEKLTAELERGRELGRVIVHVDMDAFYAAVEMRDCPELKDTPMAVGSMSMLSTSNYHARRYGVRAAMPGFIAKRLCPNLVIVPLNFGKYTAVSEQVREIFADYDPHFLPMSLDEAYLDITDHLEQRQHWPESMRTYHISETKTEGDTEKTSTEVGAERDTLSPVLFEDSPSASPTLPGADGKVEVFGTSPEEAVREMRFRIEQKTSLTASAGIAPNMMLAKVCSDKNKPNGQYRIPPERQAVMDFIQDLPVRKVSGIGKVTEKMLAALDIISCAQLGQQMAVLSLLFSETSWHHFLQISLGLGSTHIERDSERKSMSTERTFGEMSDTEEQYSLCRELCHDLAKDLQKEGLKGKTVTLKLKNVNFEVKTKAFTLQCAVCTEEEIFAAAKDLLKAEIDHVSPQPLRLRLMGVRVSSFISTDDKRPQQKSIVGFLKIASDSSSSRQPPRVFFRPEEGSVSESSVSSLKQQSETRSPSIVGEIPRLVSKLGNESEGTRRPQQQTFFQRALSRRLQQQSEQETSLSSDEPFTATDSTVSHACSSRTCTEIDRMVVKTDTSLPATNTASHITECINMQSLVKAQSNTLQCFTCPVCFNEMETTDLRVFNQHIDECLKGSAVDDGSTFMDVGQDVCEEEKQLDKQDHVEKDQPVSYHAKATDSSSGTSMSLENLNRGMLTIADEGHCTSSSNAVATKLVFEDGADSDFRTPFFKRFTNMNERRSLVPDEALSMTDSGSKALKQTFSPDAVIMKDVNVKISTLTCPVCNQAQDTDDLTLFNRHVDMCLNQEVLLEFREASPQCGQPVTVLLGKAKDHERASNTRGKSKRRGSSPNPPSKKSKAISTRHTIDKFFKGNSNQTF